ncbi:MAG: KH domain-containing protein [Lachnospiraceae bacterium]|nr:KH domain-containing protein [Lachnospiraceae bacterium]
MKELVEVIAKALVDSPDEVVVSQREEDDGTIVIELHVAKEDMGKVIGKKGRIAKSIRTVVKTAAQKQNLKTVVDIID